MILSICFAGRGQINASMGVDDHRLADIGVGVSTVIQSSVSVMRPEGRVMEGVRGKPQDEGGNKIESSPATAIQPLQQNQSREAGSPGRDAPSAGNATSSQGAGPTGDNIRAPSGGVALNGSVVVSNNTRPADVNMTHVSTTHPDNRTGITPTPREEAGTDVGKKLKEEGLQYDGGEHGDDVADGANRVGIKLYQGLAAWCTVWQIALLNSKPKFLHCCTIKK